MGGLCDLDLGTPRLGAPPPPLVQMKKALNQVHTHPGQEATDRGGDHSAKRPSRPHSGRQQTAPPQPGVLNGCRTRSAFNEHHDDRRSRPPKGTAAACSRAPTCHGRAPRLAGLAPLGGPFSPVGCPRGQAYTGSGVAPKGATRYCGDQETGGASSRYWHRPGNRAANPPSAPPEELVPIGAIAAPGYNFVSRKCRSLTTRTA